MAAPYPYGRPHRRVRKALLDALVPGDPCDECGYGMYPEQQLEADHSVPAVLGGTTADRLLHKSCNARRGQRLSAQRQRLRRAGLLPDASQPKPHRPTRSRCPSTPVREW